MTEGAARKPENGDCETSGKKESSGSRASKRFWLEGGGSGRVAGLRRVSCLDELSEPEEYKQDRAVVVECCLSPEFGPEGSGYMLEQGVGVLDVSDRAVSGNKIYGIFQLNHTFQSVRGPPEVIHVNLNCRGTMSE